MRRILLTAALLLAAPAAAHADPDAVSSMSSCRDVMVEQLNARLSAHANELWLTAQNATLMGQVTDLQAQIASYKFKTKPTTPVPPVQGN